MKSSSIFVKQYTDVLQQAKQEWNILKINLRIPHYFGSFLAEELHLQSEEIENLESLANLNMNPQKKEDRIDFKVCTLPTEHLLFDQWFAFSPELYRSCTVGQLESVFSFVQKLKAYTCKHYPFVLRKIPLTTPQVDEKKKSALMQFFSFRWLCSLV